MGTWLDSYISKMQNELSNAKDSVLSLLIDKEDDIRDMIKERWKGGYIDKTNIIQNEYSRTSKYYVSGDEFYYIFKNRLNPSAGIGNVDLILTGALVESIKTVIKSKGIEIISENWKYDLIGKKYGYGVYNITEEQENELLDEIMAQVVINIFNEIWG